MSVGRYSAENNWELPWPRPWPLGGGVEFAGGGSLVYESASVLVSDYLCLDPLGEWEAWLPLADGREDVDVILRYRHLTKKATTRVSRTKAGWSVSRRLPATAYSGLTAVGMMRHIAAETVTGLEALARRREIALPPRTGLELFELVDAWRLEHGIEDAVAHLRALRQASGTS